MSYSKENVSWWVKTDSADFLGNFVFYLDETQVGCTKLYSADEIIAFSIESTHTEISQ